MMVNGGAIARQVQSYCGPALDPAAWLTRWNLDPLLLVPILAMLVLWRRAARRGESADAHRLGLVAALLAFLYVSPFCALGSSLFTVRVVHHLALGLLVAPLLARLGGAALDRLPGGLGTWTLISAAAMWAWHAPRLYGWAVASDGGYWLMQLSIIASATLFWHRLERADPLRAVGALLVAMVAMGALGALITFAAAPLYAAHFSTTAAWGLAPLDDQQLAGLVMWAPASAVYLLAALLRVRTMTVARVDAGAGA